MTISNLNHNDTNWSITIHIKNERKDYYFSDEQLSKGLKIGRDDSNHIVVKNHLISKFHCILKLSKDGLKIIDDDSTNGTFIQGEEEKIKNKTIPFNSKLNLGSGKEAVEIVINKHLDHLADMNIAGTNTILVDDDDYNFIAPVIPKQIDKNIAVDPIIIPNKLRNTHDNQFDKNKVILNPKSKPINNKTKKYAYIILSICGILIIGGGLWKYNIFDYMNDPEINIIKETNVLPITPPSKVVQLDHNNKLNTKPQEDLTQLTKIDEFTPQNNVDTTSKDKKYGKYSALVIGNNNYQYINKLNNSINDAEEVSNILVNKYGFKVTQILNGTRTIILSNLDKMRSNLTEDDNFLIFYAGHGIYDKDAERGYWLPIEAQANLRAAWISNIDISDSLKAMQAKHILVIADSCYSGTMTRYIPMVSSHVIEKINKLRSRTVLASGGIEPVLDGGTIIKSRGFVRKKPNSIFTSALIESLNKNENIIDGMTLFNQVRDPVRMNADQMPTYNEIRNTNHEIGGDFLFVKNK